MMQILPFHGLFGLSFYSTLLMLALKDSMEAFEKAGLGAGVAVVIMVIAAVLFRVTGQKVFHGTFGSIKKATRGGLE